MADYSSLPGIHDLILYAGIHQIGGCGTHRSRPDLQRRNVPVSKVIVAGAEWEHILGPWLCARTGGHWVPDIGRLIGLVDPDKQLCHAAILYDQFNGASVCMHVASD